MFELTAAPDDDRRFKLCDKEVVVMQVIRTTLTRRGNGRDPSREELERETQAARSVRR